uniref:NB-ARC domain-containing protein n=1 Tax=Fagus sylvatica TaxID=28930 RepID=A0A2N9IEK8_FAGSY
MAESLASDLLKQLVSIVAREAEQEIRLVIGVDKEVRKLQGNLQTIQAVLDDAEKKQLKENTVNLWGNEVVEHLTTTSLVDVSTMLVRDKDKEDLVRNLLGEGPVGRGVAKAIIEDGGGSSDFNELQTLLKKICDLIRGKKILLVLDDVWTEETTDWEPFKVALKCGAQGSKILVTTRNERVARMVDSASMTNLNKSFEDDCWLIISKLAFVGQDEKQCEQLEDLGRKLANKCKGLPLAANTLGSLMRNKRSIQEWRSVLENNLWELEDVQKGLVGPLLLSYYESPSAIKRCFIYCAVFPKDHQQ